MDFHSQLILHLKNKYGSWRCTNMNCSAKVKPVLQAIKIIHTKIKAHCFLQKPQNPFTKMSKFTVLHLIETSKCII